ncbi:MAG: hypothetical protein DRP71_06920 [Verrucomicrobia bacterium]|nr:MAG: hypothetical protein DRP71_06920 [Verrucomicrobiota bacterium]
MLMRDMCFDPFGRGQKDGRSGYSAIRRDKMDGWKGGQWTVEDLEWGAEGARPSTLRYAVAGKARPL